MDSHTELVPRRRCPSAESNVFDQARRVREPGFQQPAVAMLVAFGAWPVGSAFHWFRFPVATSVMSAQGDATVLARAERLALELRASAVPTTALLAMPQPLGGLIARELALVMGWELAGWDIDTLADGSELYSLTEEAMAEADASRPPTRATGFPRRRLQRR